MFGWTISKLTVDQGREYCSGEQKKFYKSKGIQIESTVAYSPQQNGVAERYNRTLVEKIRTMLIDSSMPKAMWGEAMLTGVFLLNRSPTAALPRSSTPAECWMKIKPNLEKLRVFGCKAFAWIPAQQRKKLDAKSRELIMIGYATNGYRLWNKDLRKVVIARDVKFNEASFPYADNIKTQKKEKLIVPVTLEQEGDNSKCDESSIESDIPETSNSDVQITDDESEEEEESPNLPTALPSQQERDMNSGETSTRHSERERRFPGKFLDYLTGYGANAVGSSSLSDVPENYSQIEGRDDRELWYKAVQDELESMARNEVWKLTTCPNDARPLKTKWVFCLKEDENGRPVRHKARLVVKGFLQRPGIDFEETYAPVARLPTVRLVLAVAVHHGFHIHQMDVKTAFLHGDLKEELYMVVPDGVVKKEANTVCKLRKSIYGLKQSPRCWNERLNGVLLKLGLTRSKRDYCLYVSTKKSDEVYLVLYVDDLLIVGRNLETILKLKRRLALEFEMSDCGEAKLFLGMRLDYRRNSGELKLSQTVNVSKILSRFRMTECNASNTPMEKALQLNHEGKRTAEPYRELLGSLMYQMTTVRPDLCFPISYLGRFQQNPTDNHWQALKRIVRYLKGTSSMGLLFKKAESLEPLVGFVDSDWASDLVDRKSITGYIFKVFGCPVAWASRKQATVSTSSSEAEYIALSAAVSEAIWLSGVLEDLKQKEKSDPVPIFEDNRGCIGMAKNAESKRVKHIDVRHHFIRDHVAAGTIEIKPISTIDQEADLFTKALDKNRFQDLRARIGLID